MRLDKFLKVSRVLKRRAAGKDACDSGRVLVNGRAAKPGHDVKPGDLVQVNFERAPLIFKVEDVRENCPKDLAHTLFKIISGEED